jgi:3-hydroxyacyl-[acyl-carrier-protein] dehydratase
MPVTPLFDLDQIERNRVEFGQDEIRKVLPQRFEFEQLTGIHLLDLENALVVGFRDLGAAEFWIRGHIPGNPLFPGVLMLEAAAQLCSFFYAKHFANDRFVGFGGVDKVRFRHSVVPGQRLVLLARGIRLSPRISIFAAQGWVEKKLAFEAEVTGVSMR